MILLQISHNRAGLVVGANVPEPTTFQDKESQSQLMENVNPQRPLGMDCVVNVVQMRRQRMDCVVNVVQMRFREIDCVVNVCIYNIIMSLPV